jgi:hypothetical protein|tara:strand:+ start:4221 stop:4745 length:525 start_codon:yes stop_codon:yes gene_type:complete
MKIFLYIPLLLFLIPSTVSAEALTFKFFSPSFTGQGASAHWLTIENQEFSRKAAIQEKKEAAERQLLRDKQNTNYAKFIKNLESRIYAQLSKDLTDSMFGESCGTTYDGSGASVAPTDQVAQGDGGGTGCSGTVTFEGTTIAYNKDIANDVVTLTIDSPDGNTTITVPLNDFKF